jgi:hypothetical protein
MRPVVWMSRPQMARRSVVLPHPEGPRKETNSPSYMSRKTSSSAVNFPDALETLRMLR